MSILSGSIFRKGEYTKKDLALLFHGIKTGKINPYEANKLFNTPESAKRLLELSMEYPKELYELYKQNIGILVKYPLFIKSLVV
ncbi:MAG: hypothetical protein J7L82_05580, partial [Staphylothermus sp.]|nr:hypothetical protein [Staphylothermus sp.]